MFVKVPKWKMYLHAGRIHCFQVLLTFFSILAFFAVLLVAFAFSFFILLHKVTNQSNTSYLGELSRIIRMFY